MNNNSQLGIERFIDGLGRLVIPKEMRDTLNFDNGQLVSVKLFKDHIRIEKSSTTCFLCGNNHEIQYYKNHPICGDCLGDIASKFDSQSA